MSLPQELTTVTKVAKAVALIMFITLPILAFIFGMNFQQRMSDNNQIVESPTPEPVACTMDALICPDGTAVGRVPPSCEFEACPSEENNEVGLDTFPMETFVCPESDYVDCMPGPEPAKLECTDEFLSWATQNCPDFQGAAY